jgi:hypothetical protein
VKLDTRGRHIYYCGMLLNVVKMLAMKAVLFSLTHKKITYMDVP